MQKERFNADLMIQQEGKDALPLMLFDDPTKKRKLWDIEDSKRLPPMFTSDTPANSRIPPLRESIINQDYFHAGSGEVLFEHGKRVYNSPGADTRINGRVRLSPKITKATITKPATCTLYCLRNRSLEENATTGWTFDNGGNGAAVFSATTDASGEVGPASPDDGTYFAQVDTSAVGGAYTMYVYQDIENYANFKSKSLTVSAALAGEANGTIYVGIDDGVSNTYSAGYATNSWSTKTATRTIEATATRVRIIFKIETSGDHQVWFDDVLVTIAGDALVCVPVVALEKYGSNPYAACGYYLAKWDGTDWDLLCAFTTPITDIATWGAYLMIALGTSTVYWYFNGTTYTRNLIASSNMQYLSMVGATLWGNTSAYQVKSSTNPIAGGSWSTATDIINSNKTITGLTDHPDVVTVSCTDNFCEIDGTGAVVSLIPDLYRAEHTKTGRGVAFWKGNFYVPTGLAGGLYEYDYSGAAISTVSPKLTFPTQGDFDGFCMAMDGDDEYFWVCIDNDTKTEFICGRWESITDISGNTESNLWWHHMIEQTLTDTSDNIRCVKLITYSTTRSLWLGCAHATDGIYYIDPDTNMGLAGDLLTSWHIGDNQFDLKTFYSVTLRTENCDANKTITVYYKKEWETSFTSLGTITSDTATTLYFSDYITTKKLQLKFSFASNSATTSPHLLGYTLRCVSRPFDQEVERLTVNEYGEFSIWGGADTSWQHPEYRNLDKNYYTISALTEGLTNSKTIKVEYKLDDDSSYHTLEQYFTESPHQTLYLPELTGKYLKLKFTLSSPSDTTLIAYIVGGKIRAAKRKQFNFTVHVAAKLNRPNGSVYECNVDTLMKSLRAINNRQWPVKLKTFDGQDFDITIENLKEALLTESTTKAREYAVTIEALEALIEGKN